MLIMTMPSTKLKVLQFLSSDNDKPFHKHYVFPFVKFFFNYEGYLSDIGEF